MNNIDIYNQKREEARQNLEAQYQYNMAMGYMDKAYRILRILMEYGMVDKRDDRITIEADKIFSKHGVDTSLGRLDRRREGEYIPSWVYGDIPITMKTTLESQEHSHHHLEYSDIHRRYTARELDVEIKLIENPIKAISSVEDIGKIYSKNTGTELKIGQVIKEASIGCSRIYNINITSNIIDKYKHIGYILLTKNNKDGEVYARLIVKPDTFEYYYIDLLSSIRRIMRLFGETVGVSGDNMGLLGSYDEFMSKQQRLFADNRIALSKYIDGASLRY